VKATGAETAVAAAAAAAPAAAAAGAACPNTPHTERARYTTEDLCADAASGFVSFFIVMVSNISFASSVWGSDPRLKPFTGTGIQMTALGCAVSGVPLLLLSRCPTPIPGTELFPSPFYAVMARRFAAAASLADDPSGLALTFAVAIATTTAATGIGFALSGRSVMMRSDGFLTAL
jgi:hypothetical protein